MSYYYPSDHNHSHFGSANTSMNRDIRVSGNYAKDSLDHNQPAGLFASHLQAVSSTRFRRLCPTFPKPSELLHIKTEVGEENSLPIQSKSCNTLPVNSPNNTPNSYNTLPVESYSTPKVSPFFAKYGGALKAAQQSKLHWKKIITNVETKANREILDDNTQVEWKCEAPDSQQEKTVSNNCQRQQNSTLCKRPFNQFGRPEYGYNSMMNSDGSLDSKPSIDSDGLLDISMSLDLCSQFSLPSNTTDSLLEHCDNSVSSSKLADSSFPRSHASYNSSSSHDAFLGRVSGYKRKKCDSHSSDSCDQQQPHSTSLHHVAPRMDSGLCQVCDDVAAGFYCGAFVCEACKKFFIRASKQEKQKFVCLRQGTCKITKESRVQCQYCRFQKCKQLDMYYPGEGKRTVSTLKVSGIPCRVCGAPSSGFHFGALTCEGCKGFFRRMVKEREPGMYKCSTGGVCEVSTHTRNMCKACRYQKCISIGMSVEGSRIGRQPNAVKHAISLEVKKQNMEHPLVSNCSVSGPQPASSYQRPMPSAFCSEEVRDYHMPSPNMATDLTTSNHVQTTSPGFSFADVELTEMSAPPSVVVKEEPQEPELPMEPAEPLPLDPEDQAIEESLKVAAECLRPMANVSRAKSQIFDPANYISISACWKTQMKHFEFHAQNLIRFIKKVPDFRTLNLDDQVALLQNSIYPMVVLNLSRDYELDTGFFNYFNFSIPEAKEVLRLCPEYETLVSHFRHMGQVVQTLRMTEMELTILSCIVLLDPELKELKEPRKVKKLQDRMTTFFQNLELRNHPEGLKRFGEMMLRVSELVLANAQHINTISAFLARNPGLKIPGIYKEMFFSD